MNAYLPTVFAVAGPLSLLGVVLLSRVEPGRRPVRVQRALAVASAVGVLSALGAVAWVWSAGGYASPLLGLAGLGMSIRLDGLSVAVLTMVTLLVAVIGRFSATYLDGDTRHGVFLGRLAATAAAVEVLVVANNLVLFWVAWVATSVALHGLLLFYPERPRAVVAARKKFVVARLGDAFLAAALIHLYVRFGTGEFDALFLFADAAGGATVAAVLLAVTALLKSAQFPTHGWLVEVMESPTPVSALLHAGILNAGPFLVLRFSPLLSHAEPAAWLLILGGGFTAVFASVSVRIEPSMKVALGYSSAAHMGFMLFVCGLGVYPAAVLHLVAHSFYKAHAFLSAGSAVDAAQASRVQLPSLRPSGTRSLAALVVATATYGALAWGLGLSPWEQPSLLLVGAVLVLGLTQLLSAALSREARAAVLLWVSILSVGVGAAFFGLEELARRLLEDSLPPLVAPPAARTALGAWVLSWWAVTVALQLFGWGAHTPLARRLRVHLRQGFYANAMFERLVGWQPRRTWPPSRGIQP